MKAIQVILGRSLIIRQSSLVIPIKDGTVVYPLISTSHNSTRCSPAHSSLSFELKFRCGWCCNDAICTRVYAPVCVCVCERAFLCIHLSAIEINQTHLNVVTIVFNIFVTTYTIECADVNNAATTRPTDKAAIQTQTFYKWLAHYKQAKEK